MSAYQHVFLSMIDATVFFSLKIWGCVKTYDVLFRMNTDLAAILVFQRMPWF